MSRTGIEVSEIQFSKSLDLHLTISESDIAHEFLIRSISKMANYCIFHVPSYLIN